MHASSLTASSPHSASAEAKSGYLRSELISSQRFLRVDHEREIESKQPVLVVVEMFIFDRRDKLRAGEAREELLHALERFGAHLRLRIRDVEQPAAQR